MKEVIFRDFFTEYTNKERLRNFVPFYYIGSPELVIIKELLDNAADAVEENKSYEISITITSNSVSITNDGVIPERVLCKREFTKGFLSSKFGFKSISRGLVGHGLKICICLCLFYLERPSLVIESGTYHYTFTRKIHPETGEITLEFKNKILNPPSEYTTVKVNFSPYMKFGIIKQYIHQYILLNPHITFNLHEIDNTKTFNQIKKININKKADIKQYSQKDFIKLFNDYKKGIKKFSLSKFLSKFNISSTHLRNLSELKNSDVKELYQFINSHSKEVNLPDFDKNSFTKRFSDLDSNLKILSFKQITDESQTNSLIAFTTPYYQSDIFSMEDKIIFSYNGSILSPESIYYPNETGIKVSLGVKDIISKLTDKRLFLAFYSKNLQVRGGNKEDIIIPFDLSEILKEFTKKETPNPKKDKYFWWIQTEQYNKYHLYSKSQRRDNLLVDFSSVNNLTVKHYFLNEVYKILKSVYDKYGPISVRSLYYQLVAKEIILSDQQAYKCLVDHLTDAREAGYIPWDMFIDESRPFRRPPPSVSLEVSPSKYLQDRLHSILRPPTTFDIWERLKIRVEVWVEKVAMIPILEPTASKYFIGIQPTKGFSSSTVLNEAVRKITTLKRKNYQVYIFYFGDLNPSGICIWENIYKKLHNMANLKRLAVNSNQTQKITASPEPPKPGDPRTPEFIKKYGDKCYELEAFDFAYIQELLEQELKQLYQSQKFQDEIDLWIKKFNKISDLLKQNLKNTPFFD